MFIVNTIDWIVKEEQQKNGTVVKWVFCKYALEIPGKETLFDNILSLIVEKNKKEEVNVPGTADKTAGFA